MRLPRPNDVVRIKELEGQVNKSQLASKSTRRVVFLKIDFRAFSGANLVTLPPRIWGSLNDVVRITELEGQVRSQVYLDLYWRSSDSDDVWYK